MPASYVKAYAKRGKNDAADAAAICEAVCPWREANRNRR
jgi:transposase